MKMKIRMIGAFAAFAVVSGSLLFALSASAQTAVAFQQRHFGDHSDGSSNAASVPCCTSMGTYDTRTVSSKHPPNTMNRGGDYFAEFDGRRQYGTANAQAATAGGLRPITIPSGIFQTNMTLPLITLPGGNLVAIETMITRTVRELNFAPGGGIAANHVGTADFTAMAIGAGNLFFEYNAADHIPTNTPTFRGAGWTPNLSHSGRIRVTPSADQYGGLRDMVWDQFAHGFNTGVTTATLAEFNFVVRYGPGAPIDATFGYNFTTPGILPVANASFMASDVVRRSTESAPFKIRETPGTMGACCTGMVVSSMDGTGWFDFVDFTTGTIQVLANTIGTIFDDFSTRTEMGSYAVNTTAMGGLTGQMQLVSGGLLNSRGATISNLAHTHNTQIKFAPEPASAGLLGAGAVAMIAMAIRERRRNG